MKKTWLYLLLLLLIPAVLLGSRIYQESNCNGGTSDGTSVWVPHLNMCAATESEGSDHLVLDVDTVCGPSEWDCRYVYRSPVTGEILDLPEAVNVNFTPSTYPTTFSPDLKNLIYVERNEAQALVHVYDLVNEVDHSVVSIGFEASHLSSFNWTQENQFSFVALHYNAADAQNFSATRYLYEWHEEIWSIVSVEPVHGGAVECNPVYCEVVN